MDPLITDFKKQSYKSINFLKEDLKSIRTGKSNPAMLENLIVEAYAGQSKLKLLELATILTEGPTTLIVTPYDSSTISDIEKALSLSSLGVSSAVQGNRIIVRIPPLSEEQREKLIRVINQKIEDKKNNIRIYRDETRKKVKQLFENKEISEDQKFKLEKDIDSETQLLMEELHKIKENKEKEIREI